MPDNTTPEPDPNDVTQQIIQSGLLALSQAGQQQPAQRTPIDTAATAPSTWQGRLGEWLAGGPPTEYPMTQQEREVEGRRALWNASIGLLGASGTDTIGQALAGGFLGARRQQLGSEASAADLQEAAQTWQQQQLQNRIAALKEALPYVTLQQKMAIARGPNPLVGGTIPGTTPGTQIGAGLTGDINKDRPIIAQRESGGDPTALNYVATADPTAYARGATASGKYQFTNSTWQEGMKLAGLDPSQYATAREAPEAVQDKVFDAVYGKYGTKPWDPTQWKQNWVPTPTGQFILAGPAKATTGPPVTTATTPPAALTAGATVGPAATTPGVPAPPGGPAEAAAKPYTGGGVGAALAATAPDVAPNVGGPQYTVAPPPVIKGAPFAAPAPAGRKTADIIQQGMKLAQATPVSPGTVLAAGPAAGSPPAAPPAAAAPGAMGTVVGNYNIGPIAPPVVPPATTTTPPAVPTPQVTTQATQPPAPGGRMTWEDWQQAHAPALALTDQERAVNTVQPPNLDELRRAQAAAAQQLQQARAGLGGDPNKSISDYNTATKAITDAQANAAAKSAELQATALAKKQDLARQLYEGEQTRILQAEENEKQRQNAIAIERLKGEQAIQQAGITSDVQAGQKALEAVNNTREGAQDTINTLEMAKNLSKQAGTSGFLQQWPQVANALVRNNLLTPDEVQQLGAQRSLDAVMNKVILSMRAGSGMSRMTNFDLQFLQNTAPSSFTPEQMRPAMFAAIQTAAARQVQYADRVNELHASGMPVWQARQQADIDLGHMVKETPTLYPQGHPMAGQPMSVDDQNAWIRRNVQPGSFYVQPNGSLAIRGEGKQGQQ